MSEWEIKREDQKKERERKKEREKSLVHELEKEAHRDSYCTKVPGRLNAVV